MRIRFLANENIPLETVKELEHKTDIVSLSEKCPGLSDEEILKMAHGENRILITFDKDFGELIFKRRIPTRGVVLLKIRPKSPKYITERILSLIKHTEIPLEDHFCVLTEKRLIPLR